MSVAKRVSEEMGVELGKEVRRKDDDYPELIYYTLLPEVSDLGAR